MCKVFLFLKRGMEVNCNNNVETRIFGNGCALLLSDGMETN